MERASAKTSTGPIGLNITGDLPKDTLVSERMADERLTFYELIWQKLLIHGEIGVSLKNGRQLRVSIVGDSFAAE